MILSDPERGPKIILISFGMMLAAGAGMVACVWTFAGYPWVIHGAREALPTRGIDRPWLGAHYEIVVDGKTFECSGGETKFARGGVRVRYDPEDPSRCRDAATLGRLGMYEYAQAGGCLAALLLAGAVQAWRRGRPDLDPLARFGDEERNPRPAWLRAAAILLLCGIAVMFSVSAVGLIAYLN